MRRKSCRTAAQQCCVFTASRVACLLCVQQLHVPVPSFATPNTTVNSLELSSSVQIDALIKLDDWASVIARRLRESDVPCSALAAPVVVAADATADEQDAAAELALWAGKVANVSTLQVITQEQLTPGDPHFAVGATAATAAAVGISTSDLLTLGTEGFIIRGRWDGVIGLSGAANSTRGSLYAALQLIHLLGVRFFTANVTNVPTCSSNHSVVLPPIDIRFIPAFEYRSVDGWAAEIDPQHTRRHHLTDMHRDGRYATPPGIVHTSYNFFSGLRHGRGPSYSTFEKHPEWFWPHNDSSVYGQLCWNNQSMIDTIVGSVRTFLAEQPNATLISVSQNDNMLQCLDPAERAIVSREQSDIGPLLQAVNQVADSIRDSHPHVAVSTLAYDWGEEPPVHTKPRSNVVIRLCTGSMNFGRPLTDPSNSRFREIIEGWRYKANATRLYVWNYVVDSANSLEAYPDYFVLAKNIKYFAKLGVRGLYEEGPGVGSLKHGIPEGPGPGTDMEEFKDYVMATMMWDPSQNATEVENEFLVGYFTEAGAPHVRVFLETLTSASERSGVLPMHTISPWNWKITGPAFLNASHFTELLQCNSAFRAAFGVVKSEAVVARLHKAYMSVLLPSLWRWNELRAFSDKHDIAWPLPTTKQAAFDEFARIYNATHTAGIYYNNFYAIPAPCVYGCALQWLWQCIFTTKCGVDGHLVPSELPGRMLS